MNLETQIAVRDQLRLQKEQLEKVVVHDRVKVKSDSDVWDAQVISIRHNPVSFNDFRVRYDNFKELYWVAGTQIVL